MPNQCRSPEVETIFAATESPVWLEAQRAVRKPVETDLVYMCRSLGWWVKDAFPGLTSISSGLFSTRQCHNYSIVKDWKRDLTSRGSNPEEAMSLASVLYNPESTVCWHTGAGESWGVGVLEELLGLKQWQGCRRGESEGVPGTGNRMSKGAEVGKGETVEGNLKVQGIQSTGCLNLRPDRGVKSGCGELSTRWESEHISQGSGELFTRFWRNMF